MKKLTFNNGLSLVLLSMLMACEDPTEELSEPALANQTYRGPVIANPSPPEPKYYWFDNIQALGTGTYVLVSPGKDSTDNTEIYVTLVGDSLAEVVAIAPRLGFTSRSSIPSARSSSTIVTPTDPVDSPPTLATLPVPDCTDSDLPITSYASSRNPCVSYQKFCQADPQDEVWRCILWDGATLYVPEWL